MTADPRALALIQWIATHAEHESRLLTPHPAAYVWCDAALDEISRLFDIPKDVISQVVDEAQS